MMTHLGNVVVGARALRRPCALYACLLGLALIGALGLPGARAAARSQRSTDQQAGAGRDHRLSIKDPRCIPGECVCRGRVDRRARLRENGPAPEQLRRGVGCIVADFDGNGARDYALPGAEGVVTVILSGPGGSFLKSVLVDAGGAPSLYTPRKVSGPRGEPASELHGLVVPNVGRYDAVFLWNGRGFTRTLFPASP